VLTGRRTVIQVGLRKLEGNLRRISAPMPRLLNFPRFEGCRVRYTSSRAGGVLRVTSSIAEGVMRFTSFVVACRCPSARICARKNGTIEGEGECVASARSGLVSVETERGCRLSEGNIGRG
jgi:hypothetical protein